MEGRAEKSIFADDMENEWMTTMGLLGWLKANPDREVECRLWLGRGVGSTHYWYWDSKCREYMHTRDWHFQTMKIEWIMEDYGNCRWRIEQ